MNSYVESEGAPVVEGLLKGRFRLPLRFSGLSSGMPLLFCSTINPPSLERTSINPPERRLAFGVQAFAGARDKLGKIPPKLVAELLFPAAFGYVLQLGFSLTYKFPGGVLSDSPGCSIRLSILPLLKDMQYPMCIYRKRN